MSVIFRRIQAIQDSLSDDILMPLKSYKYQSVDKSFISNYILRHYWNAFVEILPLSLAPNMVTLLGFLFIVGNVMLIEIYMPDLVGPGPSWLYYSFAFGMWMYSTLDNVDGKQARRTGTSSGLGELFDHGIDSLNCTLASLLETAAMGYGSSKLGAYTALVPCLAMYFSTWETYHTHTLYLGYFNGPTEGLLIAIAIMIASGVYGPQIWSRPIVEFLNYPQIFGNNSMKDLWIPILLGSFFLGHLPGCVLNVVAARRKQGLPITPIFKEWVPMIVFTGCNLAWLFSPYSTLLAQNRLVLYCWTISFVFGRMTTKIILAHLLRQPFPYWTVLQTPLIGGAILANLPRLGLPMVSASFELLYLRLYLLVAFVAYMHWAFLVINRITTFLGINCLTIRRDKSIAREQAYREFGEGTLAPLNPSADPSKGGYKSH
ncbi:sn-1,2-diacylglycerol cholinephosphotransferase [Aspergillus japonicus CBS 114.51]|uniref:sn-1,2-diacylglycerol cholinephosphotransferase n=2 Tax=Aspergillus TaxID=5052 RepID=A0A2V5H9B4_ASPV1|nr:sn-1,2-diacylglycerol cholinephosphotransferase [Aspergillus japonicus CBS 114.51]PYI18822.1 sn-1,2-diacylglycerol cholinephosphotransferase [Aspergillus violaceofuscus CBS 115571]RAH81061.1 sn-1,2-diacylglycerol cholinephosphotransferase [Aspergillus japonicus CBS 114.51]